MCLDKGRGCSGSYQIILCDRIRDKGMKYILKDSVRLNLTNRFSLA